MSREFDDVVNQFGQFVTEQSKKVAQPLAEQEVIDESDMEDIFFNDGEEIGLHNFNLKEEVAEQILLLKSIRKHLFYKNGQPREDTESSDISSYMNASLKLLTMLQKLNDDLKTDEDVRKIETAVSQAMEDCPCPEFVEALQEYIAQEEEK